MVDTNTKSGKAAFVLALITVAIGATALAGWSFHIEVLKAIFHGTVTMNPVTALAMILAGTSLGLSLQAQHQRNQNSRIPLILTARASALAVAVIGLIKLTAIISDWDMGIDQWLFPLQVSSQLPLPSRIAPNVALNFLLLGCALLFVNVKSQFVRQSTEFAAVIVGFGSLLAVLGYAYHIQSFYRLGVFIPMALSSALAFSALTVAFFLSHTDNGLMAIFAGDSVGGAMARRLMPSVVLVPAWFGWLELHGEQAAIFNSEMGNAMFAVANILIFTFLVCWSAQALFHADLERKRSDEIVRRFAAIVEDSEDAIISKTLTGIIASWNPAAEKMFGYTALEIIGQPIHVLVPTDRFDEESEILAGFARGDIIRHLETVRLRKNGQRLDVSVAISPIKDSDGKVIGASKIVRDITERKRLETQLLQSQKMETVGKLAGGVAHEFNSILTAIIGQSELLLGDLPADGSLAKSADEISKAANRAAILTQQLLAYGRKQTFKSEILDLNLIMAGMEGTLRHLMGRDTEVRIISSAELETVKVDAGQIEQVIMNMAINAHDAMPNGGKLILETANVSFDQEGVGRYPELKPGDYVMLAISDTGLGMSAEVKMRAFEPFFSTKEVGEGTGLGLSTSYGIIKQSGGHISVYSERAQGTTFKIYLPRVVHEVKTSPQRLNTSDLPRGTETLLLVEDDPSLREMEATFLGRLGYTVLTAANGIEALSLKQQRDIGHIDLLFTDVIMPHMSGKELADRVKALYPYTKILFTSAYTENAIVHQGVLNKGVELLQKPFAPSELAHKVREILDLPSPLKNENDLTRR